MAVFCSCMLLCGGTVLAELNGADDFNDNVMNPTNWYVNDPLLTETNGRVEFATTGSAVERGSWYWIQNTGSYTQDWTVSIDAYNSSTPSGSPSTNFITLTARNFSDPSDSFSIGLVVDGIAGQQIWGGWNDYAGSMQFVKEPIRFHAAELRISYDATQERLICGYNTGDGFIALTNFNPSGWSTDTNAAFIVGIACYALDSVVSDGQIYADNFEAVTLPVISNHLYYVEIDQSLEYRNPSTSADDTYDFWIGILTDTTVSNVSVQCPGGASFNIPNSSPDDGNLSWDYGEGSLTPFLSQFGDGDYIVTVTYSNGTSQSTAIPYTRNDGTTPIPTIVGQPTFTSPDPLHDTLFSAPQPTSLTWTNIDPNANVVELERRIAPWGDAELIGLYTDLTVFDEATGPLSTQTVDSLSFSPTNWIINIGASYEAWGTNSAGVEYSCAKGTDVDYEFTVLDPDGDYDEDGLSNGWEAEYFGGPTNCVWDAICSNGANTMLEAYVAGLDPTDPVSVFRITNCAPIGSNIMIEWSPSVSGRVYSTLWTDNLTNTFQSLESDIFYPRNSSTDIVHGTQNSGFYQVEVEMQKAVHSHRSFFGTFGIKSGL